MSDSDIIAPTDHRIEKKKHKKFQDKATFLGESLVASVQVAEMHSLSRSVYLDSPVEDLDKRNEKQVCPCCGVPVYGSLISLCCAPEELLGLGTSFPMIFKLSRYSISALVFVSIAACIPCFIDNILQGEDEWTYEQSFNLLTPATYGKDFNVSFWQPLLHISVCGVLVFFYMWVIAKIKQQSIDLDTFTTTPSDFTVVVRGLPAQYKPEDLKSHFEEHFTSNLMKIVKMVPTYDISEYMKTTQLLNDWKFQYSLVRSYNEKHQKPMVITKCCCFHTELEDCDGCKVNIEDLKQKKKELLRQMDTEKMASVAFISFSTQIATREIAEVMNRSNVQIFFDKLFPCFRNNRHNFKGNYIYAEIAPDHTDINWENLAVPASHKFYRRSITVVAALLLIGVACAIMAGTAVWKVKVNENKENESADSIRAATIIPSIITVIVNFAVARLIRVLSAYEKHSTWTDFNRSVLNMLVASILLNNIGIPIFIYIALDQDWFSFGGQAYTVFWLEIMNALASPIILFVNPKNLVKKLQQWSYRRLEMKEKLNVSQKQANLVFLGPEVDLADRFANIIKNFSLSLFYAPIVPVGVLIAIFGLLFEMMIFKYMLLRVHTRPKNYDSDLVVQAASWMRWGLLLYSLGIFVFYQKLVHELFYLELFFFVAMSGYTLTPISALCNCCFKDKTLEVLKGLFQQNEQIYNDFEKVYPKFYSDYERENPVTREKGLELYHEALVRFNEKKNLEEQAGNNEFYDPNFGQNISSANQLINNPAPAIPPLNNYSPGYPLPPSSALPVNYNTSYPDLSPPNASSPYPFQPLVHNPLHMGVQPNNYY
jgi:hypothetical protein